MRISQFTRWLPVLALAMGLTLAAGSAQAQLTKKASILENLKTNQGSTQVIIDKLGSGNEAPLRMIGSGGTGFTWGGFAASPTVADALRVLENHDNNAYGAFILLSYDPGSYFYTIFSSGGTKTPDQYVDLSGANAAINYSVFSNGGLASPVFKIRFMIRTNSGAKWYVSSPVDVVSPVPANSTPYSTPLAGLSWYAVDSAASTSLNNLAASDEVAVLPTIATTASTPDLTKVDGGGWMLAQGATSTATEKSLKLSRLAWASNAPSLKAIGSPSYPMQPASLVLGPGAATGQLALINGNPGPLTITGLQVNSPDGQISLVSPPAMPQTASATSTVTLTLKYLATSVDTSSATLYVTCNQDGTPGTIVQIPLVGRVLKNASIYESFNASGSAPNTSNLYLAANRSATNPNQTPVTMNPPVNGPGSTGFKWGAFTNATANTGGRDWISINNARLAFAGAQTNDSTCGANYHGSYAYTIFDSLGGTTPDYSLKLEKVQFLIDQVAAGEKIRFLVRDAAGQWFLSNNVISLDTSNINVLSTYDLDTYTWKRVDSAAEAYMNACTKVTQVPIAEPATLAAGTLNLNGVTGGGVYIEQGDTNDTTLIAETFPDFNWIVRASNNDRLTIKANSAITTANTAIVPNKRVGVMALNCQVTSGAEVALDGLDVTVNSTVGLRTMFLYSDPNANGIPDDGAALTSCTVSGTTAKLALRNPEVVAKGTAKNYALVALFDDTASSKTYTFTVQASKWRQNTVAGGLNDVILQQPDPATSTAKVSQLLFPDLTDLIKVEEEKETWNGTTAGLITSTNNSGAVTGSDLAWNYVFSASSRTNAQFTNINSSMMAGVETKGLTAEVTPFDNFQFQHRRNFAIQLDPTLVRIVKLDFTMQITSVTSAMLGTHYSPRLVGDYSDLYVRLTSSGGPNYQFSVFPLSDWDRYAFTLNTANNPAEYAPGNILAYSSGDGTGTYQVSLWFAPSGNNTIAKVDLKHVASGKTLSWVTLLNGVLYNVNGIDLQFNNWANAFFDDVTLTTYLYHVNPVQRWSLFE